MGVKRDLVSFSTHGWVCVTNWTCIVLNVVVWKLLMSSITARLFCPLGLLITLHMGGRLLVLPCFTVPGRGLFAETRG
ncbi:hypothetical protein L3X38_035564 [Prunus dulcis]|uniref:Uncharacterized protein n=1 Tax=Prunus dulcis TaxID=3755 RepID=A0AAD4VJY1_PRUDU|nr:hypothetical protein L3X38_035564 [Prunus dulcis]